MLSRFRHEIDNARAHIISLWMFIALLAAALAYAINGWSRAPEKIDIHIPPDLSSGSIRRIGEIPEPNIYGFGHYMWQQINRWSSDGAKDFPDKIYKFSAYITPQFRADLLRDMERRGRRGELTGRVRALYEAPGAQYEGWRVKAIAKNVWRVTVDAVIEETVNGMPVKNTTIRYPLRVVLYDVDRDKNPWGMAIDGYDGDGPQKLDEVNAKVAKGQKKEAS